MDFLSRTNPNPRVSNLVRRQCQRSSAVTTLRHETFNANETARRLLMLLDGTRNIAGLERSMAAFSGFGEVDRLLKTFADESLLLA